MKKNYATMSEAVNDLVRRGYTHDFNLEKDHLVCSSDGCKLLPDEFEIDEVHRFEGATDPGDSNIVYAISSAKWKRKGILVNAYGAYSDAASAKIVEKLKVH